MDNVSWEGIKMTKKFKYKLVNWRGRLISRHYTKKGAEKAQLGSGRAKVYVRKIWNKDFFV